MRRLVLVSTAAIVLAMLGTAVDSAAGSAPGAAGAQAAGTKKAAKPIGYVYASTVSAIDVLAVEPDFSLRLVRSVATAETHVDGLAILHTPGGVHLYALEAASGVVGGIYDYSVQVATGKLTPDKTKPVTAVAGTVGHGLLGFDGYAISKSDKSELFARGCVLAGCSNGQTGFLRFTVNPSTGKPSPVGTATNQSIYDMSIGTNRIDLLLGAPQGGAKVAPLEVAPKTGHLEGGPSFFLTYGSSQTPAFAGEITTGAGRIGLGSLTIAQSEAGFGVYPSSGLSIGGGESTQQATTAHQATVVHFVPHYLLAGETRTNNSGPQLELIAQNGEGSEGFIDLTKAPYNLPTGGSEEPDAPISIFTLGKGIYIGTSSGRIVQATDGVGGKGFLISKTHPTVPGTLQAGAITGYLLPHKSKTTITVHVHLAGAKEHVTGAVSGGAAGVKVTVDLERRSGGKFHILHTAKPKLSTSKKYAAVFAPVKAGQCRAVAHYPGSAKTASSSASKTFAC